VRSATKVGIAVVLAVAAFVGVRIYVYELGFKTSTYPVVVDFKDVQDLEEGANVRMAGVRIGKVDRIFLKRENTSFAGRPGAPKLGEVVAEVVLRIRAGKTIPADSTFRITTGGLIGERYVDIIPGRSSRNLPLRYANGAIIPAPGTQMPQLDDMLVKAYQLADQTSVIAANLQSATDAIDKLIRDQRLNRDLRQAMANVAVATRRANVILADIDRMVVRNSPNITRAARNIADTTESFKELAGVVHGLVTESDLQETLKETMAHLRSAAASMDQTAANIASLSGDKAMRADIKETVASLRQSAQNTREITETVNEAVQKLLGKRRPSGTPSGPPPPPQVVTRQTSIDIFQTTNPGRFRLDLNGAFPLGSKRFAYLGLRDVGESTKLNLQLGQPLGGRWDLRYGLYASRLGVGLDYNLTRPTGLSFNFYDPNDTHLDIYGKARLNQNMSLYLGLEGAFRYNNPTIGLQIRH